MFGVTRHIVAHVFAGAKEAIEAGFHKEDKYQDHKVVEINTAVVVKDGTQAGNATVDLVMHDKDGNKYVAIVTTSLLGAALGV